jgi:hypothetical protein
LSSIGVFRGQQKKKYVGSEASGTTMGPLKASDILMRHEIRAQEVCNRHSRRREGNWPSPRTAETISNKKIRRKLHNVEGNETFPIGQPVGKSRLK